MALIPQLARVRPITTVSSDRLNGRREAANMMLLHTVAASKRMFRRCRFANRTMRHSRIDSHFQVTLQQGPIPFDRTWLSFVDWKFLPTLQQAHIEPSNPER